jgi:hypothetical protein
VRNNHPLPVLTEIVLVLTVEDGTDELSQNFEYQEEDNESYYVVHINLRLDDSTLVLGSTRTIFSFGE